MAAKCPACGFESPDGAQWCEFCKEPFNKKKAPPPTPAPAPTPSAGTTNNPPPPTASRIEDLPPEVRALLSAELRPGQDGEAVPEAPKWLKTFAVGFVALIALMSVAFAMMFIVKTRAPR